MVTLTTVYVILAAQRWRMHLAQTRIPPNWRDSGFCVDNVKTNRSFCCWRRSTKTRGLCGPQGLYSVQYTVYSVYKDTWPGWPPRTIQYTVYSVVTTSTIVYCTPRWRACPLVGNCSVTPRVSSWEESPQVSLTEWNSIWFLGAKSWAFAADWYTLDFERVKPSKLYCCGVKRTKLFCCGVKPTKLFC